MNTIETSDLIDTLILERAKYILVVKNDLKSIFGKFFKVNNTFIGNEIYLTLVVEEVTGSYVDIFINDIMSIEILKSEKKFKVILWKIRV